ncbi:hypothetical protein M0804_004002 [Polistes exclamans]|nr:hypothetical protein M0804_004002 [Polistes exclamans]
MLFGKDLPDCYNDDVEYKDGDDVTDKDGDDLDDLSDADNAATMMKMKKKKKKKKKTTTMGRGRIIFKTVFAPYSKSVD